MRILIASHFFPPLRNAGTENYTLGVAQALLQRGHEAEVVCAGDWERGEDYWNGVTTDRHREVPVHRVNLNWTKAEDPNRVLYDSSVVSQWLDNWLPGQRVDVVHVTSVSSLGLGLLATPRRHRIPTVLTLMDFWFLCPRTVLMRSDGQLCDGRTTPWQCLRCLLGASNLYRRLEPWVPRTLAPAVWTSASALPALARRRGLRGMTLDMRDRKAAMQEALRWPAVVLAHSQFVRDTFAQAGISNRVRHLPNGHDLGWLRRYRGKTLSPTLRVSFTGQITAVKGVHVLVDAFRRLNLGDRARLDIWGDQTTDPGYAERVRSLVGGHPHIALRGRYTRDELPSVFAETDVLVVPSTWFENAPLVIQEAFAARTPVIATRLGGMAEAVTHGVSGLLFERDDPGDLARQLRRVADEASLLPTLAAGVPPVKTIDQEVAELEDVYRSVAAERPGTEAPAGDDPTGMAPRPTGSPTPSATRP